MSNLMIEEVVFLRSEAKLKNINDALKILKDRTNQMYNVYEGKRNYQHCIFEAVSELFIETKNELLKINTDGFYMILDSLKLIDEIVKVWISIGIK